MRCSNILEMIEKDYSRTYAMGWDNVGLLVGRKEKEVHKILVALDATDEVISEAIDNNVDMLITHHPLLFSGVKRITDEDFTGKRLIQLIQNDICCYAMHTNYDVLGMADLSGIKMNMKNAEVLEVTCNDEIPKGIGKIAELEEAVSLRECYETVKKAFHLDFVKVFGDLNKELKRIAISPGSGKSMIAAAIAKGADVLITGDIGHHEGIDAVAQNLAVIDAGHYGIEHIFIEDMENYLKINLENVEIISAKIIHPFLIV